MIVYSKKIIQFVNEIQHAVKSILFNEMHLKVSKNRFYNKSQTTSYPIKIVIFNNKSMLGYFESGFYEMGFHECLMHTSREQLYNVIRHELAHYMTFISYGEGVQPHGIEFKVFCQLLGWGEEVYRATICLESENSASNLEDNSVLRKIQKLMALAESSNENEAEQAMIKSQQLLLKHNIDAKYIEKEEEEKTVLKRIMKQKKENAKMRSIAKILETFFVSTVYCRAGDFIYLEILGSAINVEIAEYVALVLDSELERLWKQVQKQENLKGMIAKNSFFLGLAKGYCNKIQALKREYNSDTSHALMVLEKKLMDAKAMVYQRLTFSRSSAGHCQKSSALGEHMGRQLNINPGLNGSKSKSTKLIAYSN
jgi:predicted SprT family Zn-dependent metalloprotease